MLKEFEILNFKSYGEKVIFKNLSNVNVILGENNSGKSTILQALYFIKKNLCLNNQSKDLVWSEEELGFELKSFKESVNDGEMSKEIKFVLSFEPNISEEFFDEFKSSDYNKFDFGIIKVSFSIKKNKISEAYLDKNDNEIFKIDYKNEKPHLKVFNKKTTVELGRHRSNTSLLNWRTYGIGGSTFFQDNPIDDDVISKIYDIIMGEIDNIFYLSSERKIDEWTESIQEEPEIIGTYGEDSIALMHYIYSSNEDKYKKINDFIISAIPGIGRIKSPLKEGNSELRFKINNLKHFPHILNCGGGLNQLIPLSIFCLYSDEGSTLLVEEPEICLHPKAINKLFEFFFDLEKEDKQIIFTTHSIPMILSFLEQTRAKKNFRIFATSLIGGNSKIMYDFSLPKDTKRFEKEFNEFLIKTIGI